MATGVLLAVTVFALPLHALPARAAGAGAPNVKALVAELSTSTPALERQSAEVDRLAAAAPSGAFATAQAAMQAGAAAEGFRNSVRSEQRALYVLAGNPTVAAQVEAQLGSKAPPGMPLVLSALQALFTLVGETAPQPLDDHPYNATLPLPVLLGYYQGAAQQQGLSWEYLAAINFIESSFGRNTNDSPAGAQGPMQFLPSTWDLYGNGGDIRDPHDAIYAAARYLRAMGAPADYALAIRRYNNDGNYVAFVGDMAAAIQTDQLWLQRLYYWGTYG